MIEWIKRGGIGMYRRRVIEVPLNMICANPSQPRKEFRQEELAELAASIKEYGVIQPVIVKKDRPGAYTLIAGERRTKAAAIAGLTKIPAVVREENERDAAILALIENVQRENLSYIEEAYAYKNLMEEHGLTQQEIARQVGKKQSTISNKIRILALPPDIQEVLAESKLTERHARALLKVPDEETRRNILKRVVDSELNVRQTEKLIDEILEKTEEEKRRANKVRYINYKIYVNSIRKVFGEINMAEKNAKYFQEENDGYVEIKIVIPKNSVSQRKCFT